MKDETSYCFAVLADVHGILPSLEPLLVEIQEESPDEIVVAGDFVGGPQSIEALALLRERVTFEETGFLEANRPLSRAFLESILTGDNTGSGYIGYAFYLAAQAGLKNLKAVPDAFWLAAEETYPWRLQI